MPLTPEHLRLDVAFKGVLNRELPLLGKGVFAEIAEVILSSLSLPLDVSVAVPFDRIGTMYVNATSCAHGLPTHYCETFSSARRTEPFGEVDLGHRCTSRLSSASNLTWLALVPKSRAPPFSNSKAKWLCGHHLRTSVQRHVSHYALVLLDTTRAIFMSDYHSIMKHCQAHTLTSFQKRGRISILS